MSTRNSDQAAPIPAFPWPRLRWALPIVWIVLFVMLLMNPGNENFALAIGCLPAWPFFLLFSAFGQAAFILGLLAATAAYFWFGTVLDRLRASPALLAQIWSLSFLLICVYLIWLPSGSAGVFARSSGLGLPIAAAEVGLALSCLVTFLITVMRQDRLERRRFRAWRRRFAKRELNRD